jgi:hypothetical protein
MKTTGRQKLRAYVKSATAMREDGIPNRVHPLPLWLMAQIQAIGFRRDDLALTHLRKISHAMGED